MTGNNNNVEEVGSSLHLESTMPKENLIKPKTAASHLSELKSYYVDRRLSLKSFDNLRMVLIIKKERGSF